MNEFNHMERVIYKKTEHIIVATKEIPYSVMVKKPLASDIYPRNGKDFIIEPLGFDTKSNLDSLVHVTKNEITKI